MIDDPVKTLWIDFLKSLTRALVQINLYKTDHPQVTEAVNETYSNFLKVIENSPTQEFVISLDRDKLLVNGVLFLSADKVPNSLKNVFTKFQIQSISFMRGVTQEQIRLFCQGSSLKTGLKEFLKQNSVDRIILNQAIYARVEKALDCVVTKPVEQETTQTGGEIKKKIEDSLINQQFELAIKTLIDSAIQDETERKKVFDIMVDKFKSEVEERISKAIDGIRKEKKKVENEAIRTEAVVSNIADGVVMVDREGRILMMNEQAETISGHKMKELAGGKIFDISHLEKQVVTLAEEIGSESTRDISKKVLIGGNSEIANSLKKSMAIIQNEEGKIVGTISIPTHEAKLKEVQQLQQDFVMNMTHELRSPLTSMKAALEMLSAEIKSNDTARNILNTAIRNSERLNSIITDILDFSKLQSGKLIFHVQKISPLEIARDAIDSMKTWAHSKNIRLTLNAQPDLPDIYADKKRSVQILINLISNAIKFTPNNGSVEVKVETNREGITDFVFFSVKDTGCGIRKEDHERIFEKFVQVATGEKTSGTGLGLAITKAMVVMQGGKISVESEYGKGATFTFTLPVYRGQSIETPEVKTLAESRTWWKKLLGIK